MEFTHIPNIDEKISRIGLGTWSMGGWMWGGSDESEAIATIHRAIDLGVNCIDTAPVYGFGKSEEIVGKALKQKGLRNKVVIATKLGLSWENEQKVFRDSRKATIIKEIEASLKRMHTDTIDLYQVHWPDPLTPYEETAEALHALLKQGKIRAIGVCNYTTKQIEAFCKGGPLHSVQSPFNLFESWMENTELAYALKHKLAVFGYGSLCRGLLSGKMSKQRKFGEGDLRNSDPKFQEPVFSQYLSCTEKLAAWAKQKYNRPLLALAIRWCLDKGVSISLWGARKPEQLSELSSIFGWKLTAQDLAEIDQIVTSTVTTPIGPQANGGPPNRD